MGKDSKKKNDQIKVTITSMRLPVKLNDDELLARGRQLVENMRKTASAEEAREVENKKRKSEIELLEEVTAKLSGSISSGSEEREVECEMRKDYAHGSVTTVRSDTGEVVDERVMSVDERQEVMPFVPPKEPMKGRGGDPFAASDSSDGS